MFVTLPPVYTSTPSFSIVAYAILFQQSITTLIGKLSSQRRSVVEGRGQVSYPPVLAPLYHYSPILVVTISIPYHGVQHHVFSELELCCLGTFSLHKDSLQRQPDIV